MIDRLSKQREDEGFTLIELLVVIIIIGILAAIAIPVFLRQRENAWNGAVQADLRNAATAEETYLTQNNAYSTQSPIAAELVSAGFKYSDGNNYQGGTAAIDVTANAGADYCLIAQSASGTYFSYGSTTGLQEQGTTATCPAQ